ncbi:MAG: hypothetical protein P0Y56_16665 [Candidatus Andeanibacterium colombiense]|uniref:TonB C-terminal domain-containing protein n=1 Tax=Candidatus Andeanibacterium colombiense TaxID=3121345 RepID=A0AAJ6BP14_9SPHN|nr:MAG: hypothetical protein P0Y56_16665 [Sphingomonadaceae bacterium]
MRGTVPDKTPAALFSAKFTTFDEERDGSSEKKRSQKELDLDAVPVPPEAAFEEQTTSLLVKFGVGKQIVLHTGRMTKPLAALRTCVDSLEKSWGLDPAAQNALTRQVVLIPSTIKAIQANYPAAMVYNGLSAYVPVRVMVDAAGDPGTCVVQSDGVDPAFKKAVCDGFARPFKPALDAQGTPIASVYTTAVVFRLN